MKLNQIPTPFPLFTTQQLHPGDRIVLVGDNGIGKSLWVSSLKQWVYRQTLAPWSFVDQGRIKGFDLATVKTYLELLVKMNPQVFNSTDFYRWPGFEEGGVHRFLDHQLEKLSGGEMQWLKILIGLNMFSQYLVWDEPTQFLDSKKKKNLWTLLGQRLKPDDCLVMILHQDFPPFKYKTWVMEMGDMPQQRKITEGSLI